MEAIMETLKIATAFGQEADQHGDTDPGRGNCCIREEEIVWSLDPHEQFCVVTWVRLRRMRTVRERQAMNSASPTDNNPSAPDRLDSVKDDYCPLGWTERAKRTDDAQATTAAL